MSWQAATVMMKRVPRSPGQLLLGHQVVKKLLKTQRPTVSAAALSGLNDAPDLDVCPFDGVTLSAP